MTKERRQKMLKGNRTWKSKRVRRKGTDTVTGRRRGGNNQTTIYRFLTEVLDSNWRVVHASPVEMRSYVKQHNKRFKIANLVVDIRLYPQGCEIRRSSRDGREG